jgi:hypothetical protein
VAPYDRDVPFDESLALALHPSELALEFCDKSDFVVNSFFADLYPSFSDSSLDWWPKSSNTLIDRLNIGMSEFPYSGSVLSLSNNGAMF